jgi:hypothetical protein
MKEIGFDNFGCLGVYYCDGSEFTEDYRETQYYAQKGFQNGILAPLYQQAFRWVREQFGIDVCIIPKFGDNGYGAECFKNGSLLPIELLGNEYSYEEAQAECLRQITDFVNQ